MDHGIDTESPYFRLWFVAVPSAYFLLVALFRVINVWDFKTRKGSRASDIMAFELVAGFCVTYLGVAGCYGWYKDSESLSNDKFYGSSEFVVNHLIYPMISYQGWNFLLCLFNRDLCDPAMLGHHAVTAALAYFGLAPYLHYMGLFYFGIAELTNVPLTVVDIFKYFPDLAKQYPILNDLCRYSFALSFIILRLIVWPIFSYTYFWTGSIDLIRSEKAHSLFVVIFFLSANVFLTFLQFFWGSKIFGFLFKSSKSKAK